MSLQKLSTDMDETIVSFLRGYRNRGSLSALSIVSKYWRSIVEPVLYHELKFDEHRDAPRVNRFMLTLLDSVLESSPMTFMSNFGLDVQIFEPPYRGFTVILLLLPRAEVGAVASRFTCQLLRRSF
ncbi:hypothetical protein K458DRAFT_381415 [Lentithecium fluviatile CBS 122367]|uniref:F-box domain-containing protein n=1 Tax=Lentithecium fluviatile CBS 122367 TaxID=1168545 RepID=A0A6G1JN42_9PLEO|nr:hypothetical protein K458DRAFT_381415 [Lentithecium fluviatile CBS 122367]